MIQKPFYVFTGFLESGKTTVIKETLRDSGFQDGEKTLLLVAEEGIEEYDEAFLKECNVILEVLEEEDLNADNFQRLEDTYQPDRIMIEFNGTWSVNDFLDMEFPLSWILVQIFSCVDATTFAMYLNNMPSIMYDQLFASETILVNRCDETTRKRFIRSNIKTINKRAQIIYETVDGTINSIQDEPLPFDVSQEELSIQDDDYGLWYMDLMEQPHTYEGKRVQLKAKVVQVQDRLLVVGRKAMVCCEDDTSLCGFIARGKEKFLCVPNEWVQIKAIIHNEYSEEMNEDVPFLDIETIAVCEPLEDEYVYFT